MTSTDLLLMAAELLGGLAFFLYGMSAMSGGLEQMAGGKLERTLRRVTSRSFLSFCLGAGITIAIQSSSAMTVMLVGLVNSGIVQFADTFYMIMGSHVGTTLTAWILTLGGISGDNFLLTLLRPMTFAPLLAFIGIVLRMLSKRERKQNLGMILIGFAVLMCGMDMMSNSMNTFQENESFKSLLVAFSSPALALLISTVFTGIIQSSAATVAIVQALALAAASTNAPLTWQAAIPLVIGANIGTCVTALISAIGTSRDAKRVVALHTYTNAIGGVVCTAILYLIMVISPGLLARPIGIFGVAVVHSVFNILN
ncbi:MAG: Na/Pi cotransporter family protein, partial [Clostridia bacterium]|nr:Na/Pi cotransporter family protein [Clostridia bacterium]